MTPGRRDAGDRHELASDRLSLRAATIADVPALHGIWVDEQVRRYLWDGEVVPLERTREIVAASAVLFDERGFGIWSVRERGADNLIGFAGFWHFRDPPALELVFGVATAHWNRGVATEASRRLLDYAFDQLKFPFVNASTDVGNVASVRVLEKLGMRRHRRAVVDGLDTLFFRASRPEGSTACG